MFVFLYKVGNFLIS